MHFTNLLQIVHDGYKGINIQVDIKVKKKKVVPVYR